MQKNRFVAVMVFNVENYSMSHMGL